MLSQTLAVSLALTLLFVPGAVFCLAARRLLMSRSRNAVLYWLVGGFAFAGAAGALGTGLAGQQVDAGGMVVALASLPLWLIVRLAAVRAGTPCGAKAFVFTSVRGGLQNRAGGATSGA
jgi:hypothetical protein